MVTGLWQWESWGSDSSLTLRGRKAPHRIPSPRGGGGPARLKQGRRFRTVPFPSSTWLTQRPSIWLTVKPLMRKHHLTQALPPNLPHQPRSRPSLSVDNGTGSFCFAQDAADSDSRSGQKQWHEVGREAGRRRCPSNSALNCFSQPY